MRTLVQILIILTFYSCTTNESSLNDKIKGTWKYDYVLTPENQKEKIKELTTFVFKDDGKFEASDIYLQRTFEYSARYSVVDTTETKSNPVLIIFHERNFNNQGDTISVMRMYEILELTSDKLILKHQPTTVDDTVRYNRKASFQEWSNEITAYNKSYKSFVF
jgi:hypothetical protein